MCHILVVEDERHIRYLVKTILHERGCDVTEAANGRIALQRLAETRFTLLITDIRMPDLDGLNLTAEAKQLDPTLPIIVMTAYVDDAALALGNRADRILPKPFSRATLLETLTDLGHWGTHAAAGV